jgi:adenosylcobinamide-GDP ribazoletransferase
MRGVIPAVQFLTVARRYREALMKPAEIGSALLYFPLVGLALGLILAGLNYFLERYLESEILGTVHVMTLIIMTGAVHLEEMQNGFPLFFQISRSRRDADRSPAIYGLLAILLVVLFKVRAIEVTGETRSLALLMAPCLARWAPLMLVYGGSAGGDPLGARQQLRSWQFIIVTAATLGIAGYFLGVAGLWAGLCLSLLTLVVRLSINRSGGGFDQDAVGFLIELSEALSFVLFASF